MILLLGGTCETKCVAEELAGAGAQIMISTATDIPLKIGRHPGIERRCGRLNAKAMAALVRHEKIRMIVDVTHPYAREVKKTAYLVARESGIPYLAFVRPGAGAEMEGMRWAKSHQEAARIACATQRPVLLTIGSGNVAIYAHEAARTGVKLAARVLAHADSVAMCRRAGIPADRIITGRGPFSIKDNQILIRRFGIGALVTKDSGAAGGFGAKLEAARRKNCLLVVVARAGKYPGTIFNDVNALVKAALKIMARKGTR